MIRTPPGTCLVFLEPLCNPLWDNIYRDYGALAHHHSISTLLYILGNRLWNVAQRASIIFFFFYSFHSYFLLWIYYSHISLDIHEAPDLYIFLWILTCNFNNNLKKDQFLI